jgi:molybdopterin molybdotransferase
LLGENTSIPRPAVTATLSINLSSLAGREDWIPVRVIESDMGYIAEPVFGRSNLIFTLSRADGLIRIPPEATGLSVGADVDVTLI